LLQSIGFTRLDGALGFPDRFLQAKLYPWVARKSAHRLYVFALVLICVGLGLLFVFPQTIGFNKEAWDAVLLKSREPAHTLSHVAPDSWVAKKVFRLSVPMLVRLFHLNEAGVMAAQFFLGFALLIAGYKLALRVLKDAVAATFIAAGMAFLYFGRTCFTELYYATFDGWGYCFLILTLYFRNRAAVFLFASLAAWTDERAFLALPTAMLFHQMTGARAQAQGAGGNEGRRFDAKALFPWRSPGSLDGRALTVMAAMAAYVALRQFMAMRYHMITPLWYVGFRTLGNNLPYMPMGMLTFLEGYWLALGVAWYQMARRRHGFLALAVTGQVAVSTVVAGCVYDITRSGSFLFPVVFPLFVYLKACLDERSLRLTAFLCMALTFAFPAFYVVSVWDIFRIDGRPILIEFLGGILGMNAE
jgi:hypothetical protein